MTKTNNKPPPIPIVVIGIPKLLTSLKESMEMEEPVPAAAPPLFPPKRDPVGDGKKRVWTLPTLKGSSLLEGMKKLAERINLRKQEHKQETVVPQKAVQVKPEIEPVPEFCVEELSDRPQVMTCTDPDCRICASKRRYQLALLNSQLILDEAYRRAQN